MTVTFECDDNLDGINIEGEFLTHSEQLGEDFRSHRAKMSRSCRIARSYLIPLGEPHIVEIGTSELYEFTDGYVSTDRGTCRGYGVIVKIVDKNRIYYIDRYEQSLRFVAVELTSRYEIDTVCDGGIAVFQVIARTKPFRSDITAEKGLTVNIRFKENEHD